MNRRQFITRSAMAACALGMEGAWLGRLARAAHGSGRYVVFCYFEGGWDHLLGLDPRDPAIFHDGVTGETGIEPAYDRLPADFPHDVVTAGPFTFGPAIGELAELTDHFSIVRGINMATLTHEVGRRYFLTGQPTSGNLARGSSVSSLVCEHLGDDRPVPHLALNVESYAEPSVAAYAAAMPIAAVGHLRFILQEDLGIATLIRPGVRDALAAYWDQEPGCDDGGVAGSQLAAIYRSNRARADQLVKSGLHNQFAFDEPGLADVRAHYGFAPGEQEGSFGRAALASQAIKTGLSRVVSVALTGGLDTHDGSWAGTHSVALRSGFDALARLLTDLDTSEAPEGGSLLSRTTVFVFSEFGRTARLNARGGRDHMLTNCALMAGAGIVPGQIIGSSSDNGMGPNLVDLATGMSDEEGVSLKPEHVMTTLLHGVGADAKALKSEPIEALLP